MLADRIAAYVAQSMGYDDEKRRVMAYGLTAGLQLIELLVIALIFGLIFNCFIETMIVFWGVALLRRTAGGIHCETYMGCLVTSGTVICILAAVCRYLLSGIGTTAAWIAVAVTFVFCGIILYKKVPLAAPNKPIARPEKRRRLRIECLVTCLAYLIAVALVLALGGTARCVSAACAVAAVMWWQCFTLSGWSLRLTGLVDRLFRKEKVD